MNVGEFKFVGVKDSCGIRLNKDFIFTCGDSDFFVCYLI